MLRDYFNPNKEVREKDNEVKHNLIVLSALFAISYIRFLITYEFILQPKLIYNPNIFADLGESTPNLAESERYFIGFDEIIY